MEEILKLVIEKGPREGETLQYPSGSIVKIGRLVRGNTIGIKDPGISTKHISIQFDNEWSKWKLTDLDSSNGTILNGQKLLPNVPSTLDDGDCIKIGELTSIIVKIGGVQSTMRRNPRRQCKSGAAAVVEREQNGLGLGLDCDLGGNAVVEPAPKRNLRPRAKKAVDSKTKVESLNSKRTLRSSKKEDTACSISTLNPISEDTVADEVVPVEQRKQTRGRKKQKQSPEQHTTGEQQEAMVDESLVKGSSEAAALQGKEVTDGCEEGSLEEISRWQELEKMKLGDFFDYLEWSLPKEIIEKTEEIISQLPQKKREYQEARLQRNEKD